MRVSLVFITAFFCGGLQVDTLCTNADMVRWGCKASLHGPQLQSEKIKLRYDKTCEEDLKKTLKKKVKTSHSANVAWTNLKVSLVFINIFLGWPCRLQLDILFTNADMVCRPSAKNIHITDALLRTPRTYTVLGFLEVVQKRLALLLHLLQRICALCPHYCGHYGSNANYSEKKDRGLSAYYSAVR